MRRRTIDRPLLVLSVSLNLCATKMDSDEDELEHLHYLSVLKHFGQYERNIHKFLGKHKKDLDNLSTEDQQLLTSHREKIIKAIELASENQQVLSRIISPHLKATGDDNLDIASLESSTKMLRIRSLLSNERALENIQSLLRQIVRDWSFEGTAEREQAYMPILDWLCHHYTSDERSQHNVLVPGAGLGRLVYEISQLGFICQGNEFSLFMLLPSEWILNSGTSEHQPTIYPWIVPFSNHKSVEDQFRAVKFPDVTPKSPVNGGSMSMTAGDFLQVYPPLDDPDWDAIVTCFFIDTAKNVVEYIRRISLLLKPGGLWINHGPLLYHFEGSLTDCSIELTLEEIKEVSTRFGFSILEDSSTECSYTQNCLSMHRTIYQCSFIVFQKI